MSKGNEMLMEAVKKLIPPDVWEEIEKLKTAVPHFAVRAEGLLQSIDSRLGDIQFRQSRQSELLEYIATVLCNGAGEASCQSLMKQDVDLPAILEVVTNGGRT